MHNGLMDLARVGCSEASQAETQPPGLSCEKRRQCRGLSIKLEVFVLRYGSNPCDNWQIADVDKMAYKAIRQFILLVQTVTWI